jgi:hypothetical protein
MSRSNGQRTSLIHVRSPIASSSREHCCRVDHYAFVTSLPVQRETAPFHSSSAHSLADGAGKGTQSRGQAPSPSTVLLLRRKGKPALYRRPLGDRPWIDLGLLQHIGRLPRHLMMPTRRVPSRRTIKRSPARPRGASCSWARTRSIERRSAQWLRPELRVRVRLVSPTRQEQKCARSDILCAATLGPGASPCEGLK